MVFQFVQVGNDKGAEEYLRKLGTESEVAEYVHVIQGATVTEILDKLKLQNEFIEPVEKVKLTQFVISREK